MSTYGSSASGSYYDAAYGSISSYYYDAASYSRSYSLYNPSSGYSFSEDVQFLSYGLRSSGTAIYSSVSNYDYGIVQHTYDLGFGYYDQNDSQNIDTDNISMNYYNDGYGIYLSSYRYISEIYQLGFYNDTFYSDAVSYQLLGASAYYTNAGYGASYTSLYYNRFGDNGTPSYYVHSE